MHASVVARRLQSSERGAVSVTGILVLAVVGVLAYALFGAVATDPDRYGRVAIPSNSWVSLPDAETGIGIVKRNGANGAEARAPSDLRIQVIDPKTEEPVRVDARGGGQTGSGESRWQIAAIDPPSSGIYQVIVTTSEPASGVGPAALSFGQSPVGAVGDRFSEVGDLVIGPVGAIIALALLLIALRPRFQRLVARGAG